MAWISASLKFVGVVSVIGPMTLVIAVSGPHLSADGHGTGHGGHATGVAGG